MSDLNSISFTGRLAAEPETRYTASGTAIWSARVANGYGYGDNKGTNWLTVQVFGKRAESLAKLELAKGAQVGVTGELRVREYDRKDGSKGTAVEVSASDVALLGGKPSDRNGEGAQPKASGKPQTSSRGGGPVRPAPQLDPVDEEIPFITNASLF